MKIVVNKEVNTEEAVVDFFAEVLFEMLEDQMEKEIIEIKNPAETGFNKN